MNLNKLFINAIPDGEKYSGYEKNIKKEIDKKNFQDIKYFVLRDMNINFCTGCWDCWVKTPGRCSLKDDHEKIIKLYPAYDLVIYISPVILGYESFHLKKFKDRLIPLVHPYIEFYKGEMHHKQRYDKNPDIGVVLIKDPDTDPEDIKLIEETYRRNILNIQSDMKHFFALDDEGGIADVFDSI